MICTLRILPAMLCAISLSSAARALESSVSEAPVDVAAFIVTARSHIGERVTLDNCHLVYATREEMTCIGLSADDLSGGARAAGKLLIRVTASEAPSLARALAQCDGGDLADACRVSISGEVYDASQSFGLDEARILGLREATISWRR